MSTHSSIVGPNGDSVGKIDLNNRTATFRDASTGQLVKMDLGQSDVHIDAALPMYASGYKLQDSFADLAAPPVVVQKASNKYFAWDKDNAFQQVDSLAEGPGGTIPEVSTSLSNSTYTTVQYVLGSFVPTEIEANADAPLRPKLKAMKRIMDAQRIAREQRVATLLNTSGGVGWDATVVTALVGTTNWNGGATSDPLANIDHIMEASLQPITGMLMNRRVWNAFRRNPGVQKFIAYKPDVAGTPMPSEINKGSALLTLPKNIYVSDMKCKVKATGLYDYLWPDSVVFLTELPAPPTDQESIASAYTFRWAAGAALPDQLTTLNDGSTLLNGWQVREYFDPKRGARGGSMIVTVVNDAEILTGSVVGGLITGVIA